MKFFKSYNQEVATFLLLAFLHGFVYEAFAIPSAPITSTVLPIYNNDYKNRDHSEEQNEESSIIQPLRDYPVNDQKTSPRQSHPNNVVPEIEVSTTLYNADLTIGHIGRSAHTSFDAPDDNLFTVDIQDEIDSNAAYILSYEVYGIANASGVTKSINTGTSTGGFFIKAKKEWTRVSEFVSPDELKKGVNTVLFTSDLTKDFGYVIRNLQFEKTTASSDDLLWLNDVVKAASTDQVYAQGVVASTDPELQLFIGDQEITLVNHRFEQLISLEQDDQREIVFELKKRNKLIEKKSIPISEIEAVDQVKAWDRAFEKALCTITATEENRYELENIAITIPVASYSTDFLLSIQELRPSDYAPTGMVLHNVTKNRAAYRFLPDGIQFEKEVKVKIKCDINALPKGYGLKDVQVFYFDTTLKQWIKVKVMEVLEATGEVVALTKHFTDYIAGVIQEPESPEGNAFTPTTISGIQAANPMENTTMVSVPQINDRGDATLNFPLMLPPAREGMVPDLSINYNSSADEGDFGLGWSLTVPSIEIDTRWGVPTIDPYQETESYLLNGEELLLVKGDNTLYAPHKDPLIPRLQTAKFQKLIHDPTLEILREGYQGRYSWKIRDTKTGWTSFYGNRFHNRFFGRWFLDRISDEFGNSIEYDYVVNPTTESVELYKITYNNTNHPNLYKQGTFDIKVYRKKTIDATNKNRVDTKINNRYGYAIQSPDLIDKIVIYSPPNDNDVYNKRGYLMEYSFKYNQGQFGRSLLHQIIKRAYNNIGKDYNDYDDFTTYSSVVEKYQFDYHDDVGTGSLFEGTGQTMNTYKDYETSYDNHNVFISALGGAEGKSTNFVGGASAGMVLPVFPASWLPFSRAATLGGNLGGGSSNSETKVLMADIDGDGLPDKIFKGGSAFFYRKNLGNRFSSEVFSIKNLPNLNYSKTSSSDKSVSLNILAGSVSKSFSESTSTTYNYTADVNADGLLDVVDNERVYFGYIDPVTKQPAFSLDSSITPAIILKENDIAPVLNPMPQLELTNGLMDVVMVWRAPKSGQVRIDGTISKQHINLQSGVKYSIEKLHDTDMGPATFIYGPHLMLSSSDKHDLTVNVVKGDLIFFRTHSNQMPVQELQVTWNPKVTYLTQNFESSTGHSKYSSSFEESLIVGSNYEHTFKKSGRYRLEWPSFNFETNDRITIKVSHYTKESNGLINKAVKGNNVTIYERVSAIDDITNFPSPNLILNMNSINSNPQSFHYVKVEVLSESEVNWKDIDTHFRPKLVSLDNQDDIYLVPYYSNYSNVNTNYANSDFTTYTTADEFTINHNFSLPGCTQNSCENRYVYLIIKWSGGRIATFERGINNRYYAKFRYKINAHGTIVQRQWLDINKNKYVDVKSTTTHGLGGFAGKNIFFEYYTTDYVIAEKLKNYQNTGSNFLVRVNNETPKSTYVEGGNNYGMFKSNIYSSELTTAWGSMYRNWGQFAYKGAEVGKAYTPIIGDHIHLYNPGKTNAEGQTTKDIFEDPNLSLDDAEADFDQIESLGGNVSNHFALLMPNKKLNRWESHEHLYVSSSGISPYIRFLTDEIPNLKPPTVPVNSFGAYGINKYSSFKNNSTNASVGFLGVSLGKTKTKGSSSLSNDFFDINGDGFPDIIGSEIQLTAKRGGLSNRILNVNLNSKTAIEGSGKLVGGGNAGIRGSAGIGSKSNQLNLIVGNQGSASISGSSFSTTNKVERFYVDINGDGLIDLVQSDGSVLLNYGGNFKKSNFWKAALPFQESQTVTKQGGGGVGFSGISNMDVSGGISISSSTSEDKVTYMDLNGDGLPEKIIDGSTYYINLGTGFETRARTLPGTQTQKSTEAGLNGNITICVYFPTILLIGPKFCVSLGASAGKSISSEEARYMDFDGDGFPDYVTSDKNESLTVYRSRIRRTNLLKSVTQSTGARIELDYDIVNPIDKSVIGSTYKMPYKKWALTKVAVHDGFVGDGENTTRYAYEYFNGYKDRKERSFLGFGMTKAHLLDKKGYVYRTSVTEYLNNDMTEHQLYRPGISSDLKQFLYKKGLPQRTYSLDRSKRMLNETVYTYKFYDSTKLTSDINTSRNSNAEIQVFTNKMSVLPLVTSVLNMVTNYDEDSQNSSLTQKTQQYFHTYDQFGNVKKYLDVDRGLTVEIEYNTSPKILPIGHRISTTKGQQLLRETKAITEDGLKIHEIRKYLNPTDYIAVFYQYDDMGNLVRKEFDTGFYYEYDYGSSNIDHPDDDNYNYRKITPSKIRDSFGNETLFVYNAASKLTKMVDPYGEEIYYKYDQLNRIIEVKGPYEFDWTIKNEYINNRTAISQHNLGQGNKLHTSMINDGLGRTIQVKKEIMPTDKNPRCNNQIPEIRLAVSGDKLYDEFGRVVENYLSEEEIACANGASLRTLLTNYYQGSRNPEKKTNRLYDHKDRVVEELVFGTNARTTTKYAFGSDYLGTNTFTEEITLPEGNKTIGYTNELGLQTSQKQIGDEDLWTRFSYDHLGQVKTVTNAMDHKSIYNYDNLGRITDKTLAASGITKYKYDNLGNVIEKEDANRNIIKYKYDFNRLLEINNATIETKFTYDQGGRVIKMEDVSGSQEFEYGRLGEVISDVKMLRDNTGVSRFFRTDYEYDSWGRILEIYYPDLERVSYNYNRVGQLTSVRSSLGEWYIYDVKYTHFDQPYFIEYGNGVKVIQEFDLTERLRAVQLFNGPYNDPNNLNVFSRNVYGYDKNNNIIGQRNDFSQYENIVVGGTSVKMYQYDKFNRLQEAHGQWSGLLESHDYQLKMKYLKDHSISEKAQNHLIQDKNTGHVWHTENYLKRKYLYEDKRPALSAVVSKDPFGHEQKQSYGIHANGTIKWKHNSDSERIFQWDANNNITSIVEYTAAGTIFNEYKYDGKGDRVSKRVEMSSTFSINGTNPQNGMYGANEVLYPSAHLTFNQNFYTNHYYANGKRIASRITKSNSATANFSAPKSGDSSSLQRNSASSAVNSSMDYSDKAISSDVLGNINTSRSVGASSATQSALCKNQVDLLLQVFYNTAETIDCKNDILAILERNKEYELKCVKYGTSTPGEPAPCLLYELVVTGYNYCAALE
ncbi:SpvB/TcaC N-terminal domain-containing protein, partial [Flavobacterium sp. HSC-61S13]|uniref:SpvB/TcaC N-terminal domain-containing protein n=1 Tax=Flavobacterium sp. HSC-61S13 TaxID=2910963 RepID=UPI0020A0410D